MSVTTNDRRKEYPGNGVATAFLGPRVFSSDQLQVFLVNAGTGAATQQTDATDYVVTRLGLSSSTVTMVVPPAVGVTLLLLRTLAFEQTTRFTNQGAFFPELHEVAFDLAVMRDQQLEDRADRTIRLSDTAILPDDFTPTLPTVDPLFLLGWNSDGTGLQNFGPDDLGLKISAGAKFRANVSAGDDHVTLLVPKPYAIQALFYNGIYQQPESYTVAGDTISFSEALPADGVIGVVATVVALGASTDAADFVYTTPGGSTRRLQDKLGDMVSVKDFGAVGDGVVDDTVTMNKALGAALAQNKRLYIPGGRTYRFNGFAAAAQGFSIDIYSDEADPAVLVASQSAADAGNYMFRLGYTRYSTVAGLALAANVKPNQQEIALVSVVGLEAGMVMQISSDRLWYNGHRNGYYCGEIHKISGVDAGTNTITVEDFTRDVYTTTQALVIRAWVPNRVSIRNLRIEAPYPATVITSTGIALQQCDGAHIENVTLKGFRNSMIVENLCWNSRFINVRCENDDALDTSISNGYGIESNGTVGTRVVGLYTKGLRRAWDAGSISGTTEAAVARDWTVEDFIVRGGGAWFPNTAAFNYGIGMHGSSENGVIRNGLIEDCRNGVTARGRNTTVESVTFAGTLNDCVSLHENGAGLVVRNCVYDGFNYPNKFSDLADVEPGSGCSVFVRLGLDTSGLDGNCFFDLPIVVSGNTCKGLTSSFINFGQNTLPVGNILAVDNYMESIPGPAGAFNVFDASAPGTTWISAVLNGNELVQINGSALQYSANLTIASPSSGVCSFKIDGTHYARIDPSTAVRIPRVAKGGQRVMILAQADANGYGLMRLQPESTSLTLMTGIASTWEGHAAGSSLTGSTGTDTKVSFGLMNNGDLHIENRTAGTYTYRLTIQ